MAINTHITKISQCTTPDREHVIVTLTNMYPDLSYGKKRIVMGINNNLIQKLLITPLNDLTTISESELWSISFNLMLSVLISDPDRLIHLRWTNTIPAAENGNSRSDTIISETPQMDFTSNVGFGFNITFYITQLTASGIYTSVDIGHNNILFPQSLEDLPSFFTVATLNRLITIHDTFWHCCKKSKHPDAIKSRYKPTLLTLDDPMIDPSQDSKHSCQLRCGH
ncbi:hypothetical protein FB192DRAFT_1437041 [Mucor lusitanicus]|nr:hypothetical protein FB192DRAFT_1437041 [Mucor lusitanicus]